MSEALADDPVLALLRRMDPKLDRIGQCLQRIEKRLDLIEV